MVCRQVEAFPQASAARHVRAIVLACGQLPVVVTSPYVTVGTPPQLSVALAEPV
jgi:hypothetical protein